MDKPLKHFHTYYNRNTAQAAKKLSATKKDQKHPNYFQATKKLKHQLPQEAN
jgi:hypothetical protein